MQHEVIKSGNKEPSKSTSWKVLETVMSHLNRLSKGQLVKCIVEKLKNEAKFR